MKTLLVVGGGGFIGGFIAKKAVEEGYDVWVSVRESTSRKYLEYPAIKLIVLDYEDPTLMKEVLETSKPSDKGWDYVIYNLGATKALDFPEFNRINFIYLRSFCESFKKAGCEPQLFLYMSSLSAVGPSTRYGLSKIKSEQYLQLQSGLPWVIFRPTGVYGPHEKDYLMMIKAIDRHVDFSVGFKKQFLTFIYVEDLVDAMFKAIDNSRKVVHKIYAISEDRAYTQKEFREIVKKELGTKWVLPVKLPLWATWIVSYLSEKWAKWHGRASTLNRDKFKIMKERDWRVDISDAKRDFGFAPVHSLADGIKKTVEHYKKSEK